MLRTCHAPGELLEGALLEGALLEEVACFEAAGAGRTGGTAAEQPALPSSPTSELLRDRSAASPGRRLALPWLRGDLAGAPLPQCCLCPVAGGALKRGKVPGTWVHAACLLWIPELTAEDADHMEPVRGRCVNSPLATPVSWQLWQRRPVSAGSATTVAVVAGATAGCLTFLFPSKKVDGLLDIPRERWDLQCVLCRRRQVGWPAAVLLPHRYMDSGYPCNGAGL